MPKFAANLSMMYVEVPFLERFAAAAADGFGAVEYLFPYAFSAQSIAQRLNTHSLTQALFNLPPGNWDAGERGMACHPGREEAFEQSVGHALEYALATGCLRLHAMAGLRPKDVTSDVMDQTFVNNIRKAAALLAPHNISLLIEPINARDMPGYYLSTQQQAHDLLAAIKAPNLKVQMDFYHCQITEGDLLTRFDKHAADVGHIQIASVPGRNEPDRGEVNYPCLLDHLDAAGYDGFVGCEYRPLADTSSGLAWLRNYQARSNRERA